MERVFIAPGHWLSRAAADSWFRMVRDGMPTSGITDAGRTQEEQEALFRKHFTTSYATSAKHDRRVWNGQVWWRRPGYPSAATPGSPAARHQKGLSLDLSGATRDWVRANGYRYGWIKDLVVGELWHMEYQSGRDVVLISNPGTTTGGNLPNIDLEDIEDIEEEDMARQTIITQGDQWAITDGITKRVLTGQGDIRALIDLGIVDQATADRAVAGGLWVPPGVWDAIPAA